MNSSSKTSAPRLRLLALVLVLVAGLIAAAYGVPSLRAASAPAEKACTAVAPSDSVKVAAPAILSGQALEEHRNSLLERYPFLRKVQTRDEKGRTCDIFGRPQGC